MSDAAVATTGDSGVRLRGSDRIGTSALVHTAQAVAAEALRVAFREVRARVADDGRGALAVEITAPLALPVLGCTHSPTNRSSPRRTGLAARSPSASGPSPADRSPA